MNDITPEALAEYFDNLPDAESAAAALLALCPPNDEEETAA